MAYRGHSINMFTYALPKTKHVFDLNSNVTIVHYCDSGDAAHIPLLRQSILDCGPDVFVSPDSFNKHLLWCTVLAGTGIPFVYSERSEPGAIEEERWNRPERLAALSVADRIHILLPSFMESIPPVLREKVRVIPNAASVQPIQRPIKDSLIILSVGRLVNVKQIHLLIDAFACIAPAFPDWLLEIWGDGEELVKLKKQADKLSCRNQIRLCGQTAKPVEQYARASIFCIPSRFEGFPNVVLEAMAFGLPVVGFKDCNALSALVCHGETGLLARKMTAESLADSFRALMGNKALLLTIWKKAQAAIIAYEPGRIFNAWEDLLVEAASCRGQTRLRECLDATASPDIAQYHSLLNQILRRKNVLLKDNQVLLRMLRRIFWPHPKCKKFLKKVVLSVKRLFIP